jgi:hypothetical protein
MSPLELRTQLELVARKLGIALRFEAFERGAAQKGGLCKVRGEPRIVVDSGAPLLEQIATLEGALRKVDVEGVFIPPLVRARIEGRKKRGLGRGPSLRKAGGRHEKDG